ncbi:hypothetical protein VCRA2133E348_450034 [Vibrio crassostreae]|nr:hypothetical protein VCRA2133E348_450034 [Vibrio crassostreae]
MWCVICVGDDTQPTLDLTVNLSSIYKFRILLGTEFFILLIRNRW